MHVVERGRNDVIYIGLSSRKPSLLNGRAPGWDRNTIGFHGDAGGIFHSSGRKVAVGEPFTTNDTVGCEVKTVHVDESTFYITQFTKNGRKIGPTRYLENVELFPAIGMKSLGCVVETNFGETDFKYNTEGTVPKTYVYLIARVQKI